MCKFEEPKSIWKGEKCAKQLLCEYEKNDEKQFSVGILIIFGPNIKNEDNAQGISYDTLNVFELYQRT